MRQIVLLAALAAALGAHTREVSAPWTGLAADVAGRSAIIRGPEGRQWKGRVESVTDSGIVLVTKKGTETVPRESVREIEFHRYKSSRWRVIGTAAGAGAGTPVVAFAEKYQRNEGPSARIRGPALAIFGAATAVGYFLGREADRERLIILVRP